jgi:hypothetical protein
VPRGPEVPDFGRLAPAWHFKVLDLYGPYCPTKMTKDTLKEVKKKLGEFEGMTWQEIERNGKNHFVSTANLAKEARQRLREIEQDDLEQLYSLRLSGKERVYGIREANILRILWWDPTHSVYPTEPYNT